MEYGLPAFGFWCSANLGFLGAIAPVPLSFAYVGDVPHVPSPLHPRFYTTAVVTAGVTV